MQGGIHGDWKCIDFICEVSVNEEIKASEYSVPSDSANIEYEDISSFFNKTVRHSEHHTTI